MEQNTELVSAKVGTEPRQFSLCSLLATVFHKFSRNEEGRRELSLS